MKEFKIKAERVITTLQKSIAAVLGEFGDPCLTAPADISETMELDINIAWKMSMLANSTNLFSAGKFLPGGEAISIFCRQATLLKCNEKNIDSIKKSFSRSGKTDQCIRLHR